MAYIKARRRSYGGRTRTIKRRATSKRRHSNKTRLRPKAPSKAMLRKLAQDWDHVT